MTFQLAEKDADVIYEEFQDLEFDDEVEEEYREDRMDQMISKHG